MAKNALNTLATAQDLTNSYADLGTSPEIDVSGQTTLGIWIDADVNDSVNVDLKAIGLHTSGGDVFEVDGFSEIALWTTGASNFKKYYEFDVGVLNFIKLQAKAGTVGATAGDLTVHTTKKHL